MKTPRFSISTKHEQELRSIFAMLLYEQLQDVDRILQEYFAATYKDYIDREYVESVKRRNQFLKIQEKLKKEYYPKLLEWIRKNLKVGDIVRMKGCRDGLGYRKVQGIFNNGKTIQAFQLCRNFKETGYLTGHDYTKLVQVQVGGQLVDVRDLCKNDGDLKQQNEKSI